MAWQCLEYREHIQVKRCLICDADPLSVCHHQSLDGDGKKGGLRPDTQLVPLCGKCHGAIHDGNYVYLHRQGWNPKTWKAQAAVAMIRYLSEFIEAKAAWGGWR